MLRKDYEQSQESRCIMVAFAQVMGCLVETIKQGFEREELQEEVVRLRFYTEDDALSGSAEHWMKRRPWNRLLRNCHVKLGCLQPVEGRHLLPAVAAPDGPEIAQHQLAAEVG